MDSETRDAPRLAVLIDAENISARLVEPLLSKVAKLGRAAVKRIYGDWTLPGATQWRAVALDRGLEPIQQFRITKGKNRGDSALIIDAMDLLYSGRFDGFCIVSSDGDFTRLASRLRESGPLVYGFGEKTAPDAFRTSCDRFFVLEPPGPGATPTPAPTPRPSKNGAAPVPPPLTNGVAPAPPPSKNGSSPASLLTFGKTHRELFEAAYFAGSGQDGWVDMAFFGGQLRKLSPAFKQRDFGYSSLGGLVESVGLFKIKKIPSPQNPSCAIWRIKWAGENERE